MGKTAPIKPSWVSSLDAMIAAGVKVRTICTGCGKYRDLDNEDLKAKVGGAFSLWNRRTRCRLTEGCSGWNRFYYINGMAWGMWDDEGAARW